MTTERDLIQRLTERRLLEHVALIAEAHDCLDQPEPEPLTQASIALQMLDAIEHDSLYPPEVTAPIRRALEALHHDH